MEFTYYPYEEKNVDKVEKNWGVYKLADRSKRVLFIGRGNISKHLPKHLPEGEAPALEAEFFSIEYYNSGEDAKQAWEEAMEEFHDRNGKYPKYNAPMD
jgi:hypothetical protein